MAGGVSRRHHLGRPGLRARRPVRRSGLRLDHDLGEQTPPDWSGITVTVIVSGAFGFREVALFHQPSRTLILTDTVLNLHASQLPPAIRPFARPMGLVESDGKPPVYLRALLRLQRRSARRAIARLLDLQPERVIFAHGAWFRTDATRRAPPCISLASAGTPIASTTDGHGLRPTRPPRAPSPAGLGHVVERAGLNQTPCGLP